MCSSCFVGFFGVDLLGEWHFRLFRAHDLRRRRHDRPLSQGAALQRDACRGRRAQAERGWQDAAAPTTARRGSSRSALIDKAGEPVSGLHRRGHVGRPATDREDDSPNSARECAAAYYAADAAACAGAWVVARLHADELSRAGDPRLPAEAAALRSEDPMTVHALAAGASPRRR